ncbi:MAG: hypothetical protein Q9228_002048 [Teloschistes exilis]
MPEEISHGRGASPSPTPAADVVVPTDTLMEKLFVKRGGAGNIDSPRVKATQAGGQHGDADIVPETALRDPGAGYENYHTGRGGGGNVHKEHAEKTDEHHEGIGDKLKHKILGKKE